MSMSPNSGKYAYFAGGYADDHSGPALGVADSLKPETRNLKPPVRKAFRTGSSYIVTAGWGDQFSKSLKDITWYVSEIAEVHTDGYTNSKFGRDSLLGDVSIHISRKKDEFGPIVLKIGGNVDGQSVSERKYVIPPRT